MSKTWTIQTDFTGGELSPRMYARTDLPYYRKAVRTMTNMYAQIHGGAQSRPGTVFVGEVRNSDREVRLIDFVNSRTLAYVLCFNDGYIQFVREGAFIEEGGTPPVRYEIQHPYSDDELEELKYAQIGSTLIITQQNHPPQQLQRLGETNWVLEPYELTYNAISDQTFNNAFLRFKIIEGANEFNEGDRFTINTGTNPATITYDPTTTGSPTPTPGDGTIAAVFIKSPTPPNEIFEIVATGENDNGDQVWTVTGYQGQGTPPVLTGSPIVSRGSNVSTWYSDLGSPAITNMPGAVSFYQQRLWFAGTPFEPQTIWGSQIGSFTNFSLGPNDDDAVEFVAAAGGRDEIIHLESARSLLPLSFGVEFALTAGGTGAITPSSRNLSAQTNHGCNDVKPIRIGQEVLFVQRGGLKVRSINYSLVEDRNTAPDVTILAEHITGTGLTDSTFAQDPDYIAWFTREDGDIVSFTLERDYDVSAWSRHETQGNFLSLATVPNVTIDQTYVAVERFIEGGSPEVQAKRYLEYFDYIEGANTDSALFGTADPATDTWAGLDHLEGLEVAVVADGSLHPPVTVDNGQIVLQREVNSIEVGLPFTATLELLHPDIPSLATGTSQGRDINIGEFYVRVRDTIGLRINGVEQSNRKLGDALDTPVTPLSGDFSHYDFKWSKDNNLLIEQPNAAQLFVTGAVLEVTVND